MDQYSSQHFLDKFRKLDNWTTGRLSRDNMAGTLLHCALGFCAEEGRALYDQTSNSPEQEALTCLFQAHGLSITNVNDKPTFTFPQTTPKERVIAALEWIQEREKKNQVGVTSNVIHLTYIH